jgi:diguanylate cyclase (GGDEF)-like protein
MIDYAFPQQLRDYFKRLFEEATLPKSLIKLQERKILNIPEIVRSDLELTGNFLRKLFLEANTHEFSKISNRRFFTKAITEEISKITEGKSMGASLILIDVDRLHDVNRQLGRETADRLLLTVSQKLQEVVTTKDPQKNDLAAHLGGDDFAILLTNIQDKDAQDLTKRIRTAMQGLDMDLEDGRRLPIKMQMGFTHVASNDTASRLMRRADNDLIAQKQKRPPVERGAPLVFTNN